MSTISTARPQCVCHSEPMAWNGHWRCAVKHAAVKKERHATVIHGITREQRDTMYEAQGKACAGCRTEMTNSDLQVDHDHDCCAGRYSCGECVRGLLCRRCNVKDVLAVAV